jgi:hypothetical protein
MEAAIGLIQRGRTRPFGQRFKAWATNTWLRAAGAGAADRGAGRAQGAQGALPCPAPA